MARVSQLVRMVAPLLLLLIEGLLVPSTLVADPTSDLFEVVREAYSFNYAARIKSAIDVGADVNGTDFSGYSPLQLVLMNFFVLYEKDTISLLLDAGADPNRVIPAEQTLLEQVADGLLDPTGAHYVFASAAVRLIDAGADVDEPSLDGSTPLIMFSRIGEVEVVRALIAAGADASRRNHAGETAWDVADGHIEIMSALENAGAAVDPAARRELERRPFEFFHDLGQDLEPPDSLVESVIFRGDWQPLTEPLEGKDLHWITKSQLRILRNTVFARHGHSFRSQDLREHFENFDWYLPRSGDVSADLTATEQENVALIAERERELDQPTPNDSRTMRIPFPAGYLLIVEYASTTETYTFGPERVTVSGSRTDDGMWRMADWYVLIEWNSGDRERIDWLYLQDNAPDHFLIRLAESEGK